MLISLLYRKQQANTTFYSKYEFWVHVCYLYVHIKLCFNMTAQTAFLRIQVYGKESEMNAARMCWLKNDSRK